MSKKHIKPLIILPEVSNINYLFSQGTERGKNDAANKIREDIIEKLPHLDEEYFNHPVFGSQWNHLREKWNETIQIIYPMNTTTTTVSNPTLDHTKIHIQKMAGRSYNYDFNLTFYTTDKRVHAQKHLEFKHNCKSIYKLPQFLSLNINSDILSVSYAEFYYDKYLEQYIALDTGITVEKPSKEMYLKNITGVNYNVDPFFQCLYEREVNFKKEKSAIVDNSIRDFLETYGSFINLRTLSDKFISTQENKIYLLWDCNEFHTHELSNADLFVNTFVGIVNSNTIVVESDKYKFKLLLRWRNHKGILNPAWQISILEKISREKK